MTQHDSYPHRSSRRRPSLLLRARPKTSGVADMPGASVPWANPDPWDWNPSRTIGEDSQISLCHDDHESNDVFEDISVFPELIPPPRHRTAKSFSSIRHSVDGLRALGRRLSVTIRGKTPKLNQHTSPETDRAVDERKASAVNPEGKHRHSWFKGHSINRRPSLHSVSALQSFYAPTGNVANFIPGMGFEPPVFTNDLTSGAAARAAAAAQNQLTKAVRGGLFSDESKVSDSESGIGIVLRDRHDVLDPETAFVRMDPVAYLPAELISHIFSFLSPASLVQLEAVSKAWNKAASSHHVWRNVFRYSYGYPPSMCASSSAAARRTKQAGLGKTLPNQDWKKMAKVRKTLDQRWKDGKAAAIYLKGHTDTVYCVQFDEHKIITGSRDRTIRIWDAHYPWPCLKVIGAPVVHDHRPSAANHTTPESATNPPLVSLSAQVQPWTDVVDRSIAPSECHNASILCLHYDDDIMVTGSSDFTCIVWDVKNDYKPIRRLVGHKSGVLDCCFDDRYIISCSKDTTICIWDRETGRLVKKLLGHRGPVNALQLRGDLLVSASGDGVAKLWNIASGLCVKEFSSKDHGLACVEFTEDSRTILAGGSDKVIYKYDANSGDMIGQLVGHNGLVRSLHLDSLNNRLISGSYDFSVKVFDTTTGKLSVDFPGWTSSWILSAKSDYRRIVATSQDASVVIVDFGYGLDGIELLEE